MPNNNWVEENSPERCQNVGSTGQCRMRKVGPNFCSSHGGHRELKSIEKKEVRMYQIAKFQARLNTFEDHAGIKSLKPEIGILRLTLETILKRCESENDLVLNSSKIADLVTRIERVVVSCNNLEARLGVVMDKSTLLAMAVEIATIIQRHVPDHDTVKKIVTEMGSVIGPIPSTDNTPVDLVAFNDESE